MLRYIYACLAPYFGSLNWSQLQGTTFTVLHLSLLCIPNNQMFLLLLFFDFHSFWGENDFTPSFFIHFFLLPKLGVKVGDGQHTTPALSRKGSIWPLELRLLTLTKRAQLPNVCHTWEDFYGGKAFTPTKNLRQILYLLLTENSFQYCGYVATTYKPMEQPWKQR